MTSQSENTKRIAKNTLVLYVRMLFGMLVSLYTSRIILEALGVEDFGIYNVVGGFVGMFSLISSGLTSSISRFMTFELGTGDFNRLQQVFTTSIIIQLVLAGIVLIATETIGIWFLNTQLTIPSERMCAANWAFQASIFAFILGLLSCPYSALITSYEHMTAIAYIGITGILLNLFVVITVAHLQEGIDRLIIYAWMTVAMAICIQVINIAYCWHHFTVCHAKIRFHKKCWKEMSQFAGWNSIGCSADLFREQGVNILLNIFFGPVANAARGISNSIMSALTACISSFTTALNPQIVKSYASGEMQYMFSLVQRGSRFSYYVMLLAAIPLILEMPYVLTLWLKNYPEYTIIFARLVIVYALINILSNPLITLQNATGKIRNYQIAVGGMLMMNFPLSYVAFKLGLPPYWAYIVAVIVTIACLTLRLVFLQKMVNLNIRWFMVSVCRNVATVSLIASIVPVLVYIILPVGFVRLACISIASVIIGGLSILYVGCSVSERQFILDKIAISLKRVFA